MNGTEDREPAKAEIVLYQSDGQDVPVEMLYLDETLWAPQQVIAGLFGVSVSTVSEHLGNVFRTDELDKASSTTSSGKPGRSAGRPPTYYSLDAVIAVGYRVSSLKATRFRQWATATLREYVTKGFVLDDDLLKNGPAFGRDYFDELLERIRDIRASERRVWQKMGDIFQECSFDYDRDSETARRFFATLQNKTHYAVTGQTAAEIVSSRADAGKPHMGLTSWKGSPEGKVHASDVDKAKNYLAEDEMIGLDRLVTMFLDTAEDRAERHVLTSMEDCDRLLDDFLRFNGRQVLDGPSARSHEQAERKARTEFERFRKMQDATYENDFERRARKLEKGQE